MFVRPRKRTRGVKLGRPPKGPRSSERHEVRERIKPSEAAHVNIRVAHGIASLRKHDMFLALRDATIVVAKLVDFRT